MNAKDLMIGDWVVWATRPTKIDAIAEGGFSVHLKDEGWQSVDAVEPIKLTPEILEKNGFRYNDLPFVMAWERFGLALYNGGNGYRINCGNNVALIIDSVHELQHALRLCGIEKGIEL